MQIPNRINDGQESLLGLLLRIVFLFQYMIVEFASLEKFQDHINILTILIDGIEIDDIRMMDLLHDMDLFFEGDCFLFVHFLSIQLREAYLAQIFIATALPVFSS